MQINHLTQPEPLDICVARAALVARGIGYLIARKCVVGILGIDKNSEEWYQITVGGQQGNATAIGKVIGPSFYAEEVPPVIEALIDVYVEQRSASERFIDTFERIGLEPFKQRAYAGHEKHKPARSAAEQVSAEAQVQHV